jgi:hypothetical protein
MRGGVTVSSASPVAILATMIAVPITSAGLFWPWGPLGMMALWQEKGRAMQELEITPKRIISIMWLIMWRSWIGALVFGIVAGIIVEIVVTAIGAPDGSGVIPAGVVGGVLGLVWGYFVFRMALRKKYHDFRIVLVPRISN